MHALRCLRIEKQPRNRNQKHSWLLIKMQQSRQRRCPQPAMSLIRILVCLFMVCKVAAAGFIDMDTPIDKRTTTSFVDGSSYHLVMSDEFNVPNRTFTDGHDSMWTALDKNDDDANAAGGGSLQFYNSSFVSTTENGMLKISIVKEKTQWNRYDHVNKEWKLETALYKSGMVQTWNKFCFTGGIVEVDVIFPGEANIGGLWPAVWMMGNLGRATYLASTNNIWPWSYNTCNRELQPAQDISACNADNHFGLDKFTGRGATEIDLIEVMGGDSNGPLKGTDPPVALPYGTMTLQVAPGVPYNRPQSGSLPLRDDTIATNGYTESLAETWYDGLVTKGNTSLNPFFYGTYLAETRPFEPVTRTKKQAFQADAIGAMHQLTASHFNQTHTFRVEWQPGPGGRLDWYAKAHKIGPDAYMEGDGLGEDWLHVFSIKDDSIRDLMGSQIPIEPSYLILNTAVSSTWGFPYVVPESCEKCYDCDDPTCACSIGPGFCKMMSKGDVAMYVDSIRVYQSNNPSAHVGANHTLGCDPPGYPTKGWIEGHTYRYMRNPPFAYSDTAPLRKVQRGGGKCLSDTDCGLDIKHVNLTSVYMGLIQIQDPVAGRGQCVDTPQFKGLFSSSFGSGGKVCSCSPGYTGPWCLAQDHIDLSPSAFVLRAKKSPFLSIAEFQVTPFMMIAVLVMVPLLLAYSIYQVAVKRKQAAPYMDGVRRQAASEKSNLLITGRSI